MGPARAIWQNAKVRLLLLFLLLAGVVAVIGVASWSYAHLTKHFGVVHDGVLYRGGQPDAGALEHIIARYKIKTVVNLRGLNVKEDWWRAKRDVCGRLGVRMIDVPVGSQDTAVSGLKQFLAVATDKSARPIFVHCEVGRARTGYAVAAYRIVVQGWSYDQAIREAQDRGFNIRFDRDREYDRVLRELGAGADWRHLGGSVTSSPVSAPVGASE